MTKRHLSEMEVVEVDAIDLGDWEHNMSTSEVPAAHLAQMVRQTKAQQAVHPGAVPVVETPRPENTAPDVATVVARPTAQAPRSTSPDVGYVAARPSVAPSTITPASEALPAPADRELAPAKLRPRFASPRVLLLAGGAVAAVILVVVLAMRGSGSTAEPVVAQAAASPSPSAAPTKPSPSAATTTSPASSMTNAPVASTTKSPAVARVADTATPNPVTPSHAIAADVRKPASKPAPVKPATHHSHSSHHHAAHKTVAARSAPHAESPVDTGTVDRAREAYNAGNEALFAGNSDDAIRSYKEAIDTSPSLAFGYRGLGLAYTQKGDNAAAVTAFREYLRLAPHAKDSALIRKRISGLQTAHH